MICTFCLQTTSDNPPHESNCPIAIQKVVLEAWTRGMEDAKDGKKKPAMGVLANVINLYATYSLGFERGKAMKANQQALDD